MDKAKTILKQAIETANSIDDAYSKAIVLGRIAESYHKLKRIPDSEERNLLKRMIEKNATMKQFEDFMKKTGI